MEDKTKSQKIDSNQFANYLNVELLTIDGELKCHPVNLNFNSLVKKAMENEQYTEVITLLTNQLDASQNITWYIRPPFLGHEVLIRDARKCTAPRAFSYEPYLILGINNLRACLDLLAIQRIIQPGNKDEMNEITNFIKDSAYTFFLLARKTTNKVQMLELLKHFNSILTSNLSFLLEIPFNQAAKRLTIAKEFATLKSEAKSVVTLVDLDNREEEKTTFFQADLAITTLTADLISEYTNRKSKTWFTKLPDWQQNLIDFYLEPILSGTRLLPTQLRAILVGLRNSYHTINGVFNKGRAVTLNSCFHSGTIVYLGCEKFPDENKRINILHGEQLKAATQADILLALTLNTNINPTGHDKEIVENSEMIMQSIKGLYANLPLNFARRISINNDSGIRNLLGIVSNEFLTKIRKLYLNSNPSNRYESFFDKAANYLSSHNSLNGTDEEDVHLLLDDLFQIKILLCQDSQINAVDIKKCCEIIKCALVVSFMINNNKKIVDPDNHNLKLACFTLLLTKELSFYLNIAINASCESGKDRTGILLFRTAIMFFTQYLFDTYFLLDDRFQEKIFNNIIKLAMAGHVQYLSGLFGIKEDSRPAIPQKEFPQEATDYLIRETASYNKDILVENNFLRFYFPIGDQDLSVQKKYLSHALKLFFQSNFAKTIPQHEADDFEQEVPSAASAAIQPVESLIVPDKSSSRSLSHELRFSPFWKKLSTIVTPAIDAHMKEQELLTTLLNEIPKQQSFHELHSLFIRASEATVGTNSEMIKLFRYIAQNLTILKNEETLQQSVATPISEVSISFSNPLFQQR